MTADNAAFPLAVKPKLRGVSHGVGFVVAVFGLWVLTLSPLAGARYLAGIVYGLSLSSMLGLSALYHLPQWSQAARRRLRVADHTGIFLVIAGSFTPFAVLNAFGQWSWSLVAMWVMAAAGIVFVIAYSHGHRGLRAGIYVALGLSATPTVFRLPSSMGWNNTALLVLGAVIYIFGAVVYARKKPNPWPTVFGYHEVFHAMILLAAGLHFAVIFHVQL